LGKSSLLTLYKLYFVIIGALVGITMFYKNEQHTKVVLIAAAAGAVVWLLILGIALSVQTIHEQLRDWRDTQERLAKKNALEIE